MAEIALLPRRLAEWSGAPPRWYPLQLGGCQHDANRRAPGDGNHKISRLPQATEYQEEPQEENFLDLGEPPWPGGLGNKRALTGGPQRPLLKRPHECVNST